MKSSFYLILIFSLMAASLSAKKRTKVQVIKPDTCTVVAVDSAGTFHHFPVIMVGKVLSFPDSIRIRFVNAGNDLLSNDTTGSFFGKENELTEFFVRNIVYPHQLKDKSAEDNLNLRMILDEDGKLTESEVLDSEIPEMKQEVLRVTKLLPGLIMTDKTGKKTNIPIQLPISFKILKL